AWDDTGAILLFFPGLPKVNWRVPPDWGTLIASRESSLALPFCLGNTPQLVRDLEPLLAGQLSQPHADPAAPAQAPPTARDWALKVSEYPETLLAAAVLRLCREYDL